MKSKEEMVWGKFREQGQRLISKTSQNKLLKVGPWTKRSASLGILVDMQICSFHLRPTELSSLKGSVLTKLLFVFCAKNFCNLFGDLLTQGDRPLTLFLNPDVAIST